MRVVSVAWVSQLLEEMRSGVWLIPTLCVAIAIGLGLGLIELERYMELDLMKAWPRLFGAGPDGSRSMLEAIATSMITVAGVVFSVTTVALTLASSQYTSRVLRTFLRDRANHTVLGIMVGIFAYCLVVMRTIHGGDIGKFVPQLAVQVAVLLAFFGIGALIYFIHHVATAIQATHILAAIHEDAETALERLFPEELDVEKDGIAEVLYSEVMDETASQVINSDQVGYVQRLDIDALARVAQRHGGYIRTEVEIGDFVFRGIPLAHATSYKVDPRDITGCFAIGPSRTVEQDLSFPIRQLVDVAVKALSPGVNDTTTAVMCIDYLTAVLAGLIGRRVEPAYRIEDGSLKVVSKGPTFKVFLAQAFDQVRENADGNVAVLSRLLRALEKLGSFTTSAVRRKALLTRADAVLEVVRRTVSGPLEQQRLEVEGRRVVESLAARRS